ncbi:restriction endonuclease subunit S [Enterobacter hormaechei]|uniref:restriction endonuclease subunit S n=1 Tax=Enterobacter hormaechei TaxID=158836 RepID=UPI003F6A54C7
MVNLALIPKYEEYIDSTVEWLGYIPSHWEIIRMKFLYKDTSTKNKANETLLSVTQNKGVVPREWVENRMVMPSGNLDSFKFIEKGDFAISLRSFEGGLEYCHHNGIISPAYTVLKSKRNELQEKYYKYLFKCHAFISELQTSIVGIREGKNISYSELQNSLLPIPSNHEQRLIAGFLDKKVTQIDDAITLKEQAINLLEERKQIIIQKSVTQGLDPQVPMKDSGVDWIGTIPEHWETERSRWLFRQRKEKARKCDEQLTASQKYGVISQQKFMELEGRRVTQVELNSEILKHVEANDFVISMRSFQGGIEYCAYTGCVSSAYVPLIPCKLVHSPYYKHLLKSQRYIEALQRTSNLVRDGQALRYENFCMVDLLIVPFEEQIAIANFIDSQEKLFRRNVAIMKAQIEKLKEYKTTLINSAVTGKIKITQEMVGQ